MVRKSAQPSRTYRSPLLAQTNLLARATSVAAHHLRATAFWLAITLPWLLLGLAVTGRATSRPPLLAGLVVATVCCAVLGHNYTR